MRTITVRPIRFEDVEVGATVYVAQHLDFVSEMSIESVRDSIWDGVTPIDKQFPIGHTHDTRDAHCKDHIFGREWGFVMHNAKPGQPLDTLYSTKPWYVEAVCAFITDNDGNCPFPLCPKCGIEAEHLERRVIEPEGVVVTVEVFVPNGSIHLPEAVDLRLGRAVDMVEDLLRAGVESRGFEPSYIEVDSITSAPVSENHVHVFDKDGMVVAEDVRTNVSHRHIDNSLNHYFADALEVPVVVAQREVIDQIVQRNVQRLHEDSIHLPGARRRSRQS